MIKRYDSVDHNISRSILFGSAVPFTHTGLLASFPVGSRIAVDLGVVNGWDNVRDNNDGKTFLGGVSLAPSDRFSLYVAGTYGPEQTDNGRSKRAAVTANATVAVTDRLAFVLDAVYGNESDHPALPHRDGRPGFRGADWYGAAGYAVVEVNDRLTVALRAEVFDDADGVRTNTVDLRGVTVWEITPTVSYHLTRNLLARAEYRHDEASAPIFDKDRRRQAGSDTIAGELLLTF